MKLPQVQYRQVPTSGRHNLRAVSSQAAADQALGNTMQAAWNQVAKVTEDLIERQENQEYDDQIMEFQMELADWRSRHAAKQFYSSDELGESISDDVVSRTVTRTNDEGVQVSEPRNDIPAYEVYPHLLKGKLQGMIEDKAAKIKNPNLRNEFVRNANSNAAGMVMDAMLTAEQAQQQYIFNTGVEKAHQAASTGNLAMAQFAIQNLETDELTRNKLLDAAEATVEKYEVAQSIRSSDPETVLTMRSLLEDPKYAEDSALSEGERQSAINDLNARLGQLGAERDAALAREHESFISNAYAGIDAGTFNLSDVESGFEQWQTDHVNPTSISGRERTALRNYINSRNASRKARTDLAALGEGLINNGGDSWDSNHQKQIDAYVAENEVTDIRELERISLRSGIMPRVMHNMLNTMALHDAENNEEMIPVAIEVAGRFFDQKPSLMREMGKEARDVLLDAHIMSRGGMNPMDAYRLARTNAEQPPELRKTRETAYTKAVKDMNVIETLSDLMDEDESRFGFEGGWNNTTVAAPNDFMQSEFSGLMRQYYLRTGDMDRSKQMAWTALQETWSPTGVGVKNVGGDVSDDMRAFKYAPERLMHVSTEEANHRLAAFARAYDLPENRLEIAWDAQTARDGSWPVFVIDEETDMPTMFYERWVGSDWADESEAWQYNKGVREAREKQASDNVMEEEFLKNQKMIEDGPHYRMLVDPIETGGVRG